MNGNARCLGRDSFNVSGREGRLVGALAKAVCRYVGKDD